VARRLDGTLLRGAVQDHMTSSFDQAIAGFSPQLPLAVAYSGGADSTALLVACARKWPGRVVALHVNHGLQLAAQDFQKHCEAFCAGFQLPLRTLSVPAGPAQGQSPEDAARIARYDGLIALAQDGGARESIRSIAVAQHADDQVETLLLALSRGAGLAGLSAMPRHWQRGGLDFHRPLLDVSAADLREWLAGQSLAFIEDPTNQNEQFTRNRIRARLLPVLAEVFPHFRDTFARSSAHAAQAQAMLDEFAQLDFAAVADADGRQPLIGALQRLSRPRQANVLRHWLKTGFNTVPSAAQLGELLDQIAACTTRGHQINIKIGRGYAQREGDKLAWYNP
jgi:tRNA(Ile)-lysidine synthase